MPIVAKLEITVDDAGRIDVNGPIQNRLLCYGLLAIAHDSIDEAFQESRQRIQVPTELERVSIVGA